MKLFVDGYFPLYILEFLTFFHYLTDIFLFFHCSFVWIQNLQHSKTTPPTQDSTLIQASSVKPMKTLKTRKFYPFFLHFFKNVSKIMKHYCKLHKLKMLTPFFMAQKHLHFPFNNTLIVSSSTLVAALRASLLHKYTLID